jgi:hypothetical protein
MQLPTTLAMTDKRKLNKSAMQAPPFCCQIGCDNITIIKLIFELRKFFEVFSGGEMICGIAVLN